MIDSALSWLNDFVRWLASLLPRWHFVIETNSAVAFIRGKHVREWHPGAHFYWPIWTEIVEIPVKRQSERLPAQTLTLKCGTTVLIRGVVVYEVDNILKALASQWDMQETIVEIAQCEIIEEFRDKTFDECRTLQDNIERLSKSCKSSLSDYGVDLHKIYISNFAKCKVLLHAGSMASFGITQQEDN